MESFGKAGVPMTQFDVRLRFGYRITVAIWENRSQLCAASGIERCRDERVHGTTTYPGGDRKRVAIVHLCRPALDDGTVLHETYHAIMAWALRVEGRFRSAYAREEATASELETAFVAARSHIREEQRLTLSA